MKPALTALPDSVLHTLRRQYLRAMASLDKMDRAVTQAEDEVKACQEVRDRVVADRDQTRTLAADIEDLIGAEPGPDEQAAAVRNGWDLQALKWHLGVQVASVKDHQP